MGDFESTVRLAVAAAVAVGLWAALLALLAVATRPRQPDPGPSTMELGPEPPAVVNLITSRWRLGHEAVAATLLDLAGRRIVDIEEIEPGRSIVRIKAERPEDLTNYEWQVYNHVKSLSSDGVVPCEALTTGPEAASRQWWREFDKAVRGHARALGLSRRRWGTGHLVALGILALVPAFLAVASAFALPDASDGDTPNLAFLGFGACAWATLMAVPRSLRSDRDTDAGLEAARRWLGLREHLHEDEVFCDLPPAAVTVWDRYIAYGAALDVSVAAVRELPLGSESEHEAWSSYGGSWHVVRVRYPQRIPPGWGRHPVLVFLSGAFVDSVALFVLLKVVPTLLDERDRIVDAVATGPQVPLVQNVIQLVAVGLSVAAALALLRSAVMTVLAAYDMFTRREIDGRVVRIRHRPKKPPLVAVDDGKREVVRAWVVRVGHSSGYLHPGNEVHATVTPLLGYVHRMEVTKAVVTGPAVHPQVVDAIAGIERTMDVLRFIPGFSQIATRMEASIATAGLTAASWGTNVMTPMAVDLPALSAAAGIQLTNVTEAESAALAVASAGGAGEAAVLSDGGVGRVTVARWYDPAAFDRLAAVMPQFLREVVTGVGDEAVWLARGMLLARTADRAVMVNTALPVGSHEAARDIAVSIAKSLL